MTAHADLIRDVADYYTGRLAEHGATARGVDWNGEESQLLRFAQLAKLLPAEAAFSCADIGCGYGAFHDYLTAHHPAATYYGTDIAPDMVAAARLRIGAHGTVTLGTAPEQPADYAVASGIFNVRQKRSDAEWMDYMHSMLDVLDAAGNKGFAFNCLTRYSDADRMRPNLYYAQPEEWFAQCKKRYSKQVALLHDYGLYEFTLMVRKP